MKGSIARWSALIIGCVTLVSCGKGTSAVQTQVISVTQPAQIITQAKVITSPPPTSTPPALAPTFSHKDELVFGMFAEPSTLHPMLWQEADRDIIDSALFSDCTRQLAPGKWAAFMCQELPTLENGEAQWVGSGAERHLEVRFRLNPGWNWHDGQPVTAHDYAFTWKLALSQEVKAANTIVGADTGIVDPWELIQEVKTPDDKTVILVYHSAASLSQAAQGKGAFPWLASDYQKLKGRFGNGPAARVFYYALGSPVPAHILEDIPAGEQIDATFSHAPIGNGPFRFTGWIQGKNIVLEANPDFALGAPHIKRITIRFMPTTTDVLAGLQDHSLDGLTTDTPLYLTAAKVFTGIQSLGYQVASIPVLSWEHIDLNNSKTPLNDLRVRQALAYATDKQAIAAQGDQRFRAVENGPLPSGHWAYDPQAVTSYDYDLQKAQSLLQQAGWDCSAMPCKKDGRSLRFILTTTDRADRLVVAGLLQKMWAKAGFGVDVEFLYGRGLFTSGQDGELTGRSFQAAMYTWIIGQEDPRSFDLYTCSSIPTPANNYTGQNFSGWCHAELDTRLQSTWQEASIMTDPKARQAIYSDLQKAWTQEAAGISLFSQPWITLVRADLVGYQPSGFDEFWNSFKWEIR